jgi:glycosyltransferase involved in cell wall biosynthesis
MRALMLDSYEYAILERQRQEHSAGNDVPRRWHVLIDALSVRLSGNPAQPFRFYDLVFRRANLFTWIPSREALLTAAWGRGLTYLCWGGLGRSGVKGVAERTILRRAECLLVNDAVTQGEIECLTGRRSVMIPYAVDTDFFAFSGRDGRDDFLFCNSVNDRDPEVLLALAEAGQTVVWTVDDPTLRGPYAGRHSNLQIVPRVPFPELRKLYQTCRAFVVPLRRDVHAAGQTTILEALSCGAPVITSDGRTSGIFSGLPTVRIVHGKAMEDWVAAVSSSATDEDAEKREKKSRSLIEAQWSFDRVLGWLYDIYT